MKIQELMSRSIGKVITSSRTAGKTSSTWVIELEDATYYTIGCSWRIEWNGTIITTSWDDRITPVGGMNKDAERLIGNKLLSFEVSEHYDLKLYLENGFVVTAFCNFLECCSEEDSLFYLNWEYCVPDKNIAGTITAHFKLVYTRCDDNSIINP